MTTRRAPKHLLPRICMDQIWTQRSLRRAVMRSLPPRASTSNSSCFDQQLQGEQSQQHYLDAYNGHSHGDYGYHYHVTLESDVQKIAAFPYFVGPKFRGCLSATDTASGAQAGSCCSSISAGGQQCTSTSKCSTTTST
mmetsp:Transcript_22895/g.38187  ORF Transcript_22895/g.38187 Transcript_22895/m.38187 type:complete len:138 (+) Transcript_22895:992-1405(+)